MGKDRDKGKHMGQRLPGRDPPALAEVLPRQYCQHLHQRPAVVQSLCAHYGSGQDPWAPASERQVADMVTAHKGK